MPACSADSPLIHGGSWVPGEEPPPPGVLHSSPPGDVLNPQPPNIARIYDCLLGGKDNYPADRKAARELTAAVPGAVQAARDNRAFLGRAVRFLATRHGISQFLDIGQLPLPRPAAPPGRPR